MFGKLFFKTEKPPTFLSKNRPWILMFFLKASPSQFLSSLQPLSSLKIQILLKKVKIDHTCAIVESGAPEFEVEDNVPAQLLHELRSKHSFNDEDLMQRDQGYRESNDDDDDDQDFVNDQIYIVAKNRKSMIILLLSFSPLL